MVIDLYEITLGELTSLWQALLAFIPKLILALIVFTIGGFVAVGFEKLVVEVLKRLRFNKFFERGVWKEALEKAEFKIDVSAFIGLIIKWILFIVVLQISVGILGWTDFALLLTGIINYLPNVVVAAFIFVVAVIIADMVEKVVRATVESTGAGYGSLVGEIVKWSIWIFALIAILMQLKIAPTLLQTLFTGLVAIIAIAGGIAFGLGGKDLAAEILQELRRKLKK